MSGNADEVDGTATKAPDSAPPPYPGEPVVTGQPSAYPVQPPYNQPSYQQYPPQYPPQQPYQGATQQTTIITQVAPGVVFRQTPVNVICPNCSANVTTRMEYDSGTLTYLVCGGLCLLGCWFGCCLIPFCIDDLKEVIHRCPNCNREIGRYNRM